MCNDPYNVQGFPSKNTKKLHARDARLLIIGNKVGTKVYVLELLSDYLITTTFNVKNLMLYKGPL